MSKVKILLICLMYLAPGSYFNLQICDSLMKFKMMSINERSRFDDWTKIHEEF